MKIGALILAAGYGGRFNSSIPKQFLMLGKKKIYQYPLALITQVDEFNEIFLVSQKEFLPHISKEDQKYFLSGGSSRTESVYKGLIAFKDVDFVMIFDAARPFLTKDLIYKHIEKLQNGFIGVNTLIACEDTINILKEDHIDSIPNRAMMYRGQTPQSFTYKILLRAHKNNKKSQTDDCSILLNQGTTVTYVTGTKKNMKITTLIDLEIAKLLIQSL